MPTALNREKLWTPDVWADIDKAVQAEVAQVRVAQKVLPTTLVEDSASIPDEQISFKPLSVVDGATKPVIEPSLEFFLTSTQGPAEAKILARMAAKTLAMVEDRLIFQGRSASLPPELKVNKAAAGDGLLNLVSPANVIALTADGYPSSLYSKLVKGITTLGALGHPGEYCGIFESSVFADANEAAPNTLVTPADRMGPLLPGGFLSTGTLINPVAGSPRRSLLFSLAGEPIMIYLLQDITVGFTQVDTDGLLRFRAFERFQYVVRDPSAMIRLDVTAAAK